MFRVIPESLPVIYSLLILSTCLSRNSFPNFLAISVSFLTTLVTKFPKIGKGRIKTPPDWLNLDNYVSEYCILADEPFAKALRIFETCVSVNNNLCRKLVSSLESLSAFDERFKVTLVSFFIPDFGLLGCELIILY